jgi:RNA polymerase sigma-70 factor (ECF subfamily)
MVGDPFRIISATTLLSDCPTSALKQVPLKLTVIASHRKIMFTSSNNPAGTAEPTWPAAFGMMMSSDSSSPDARARPASSTASGPAEAAASEVDADAALMARVKTSGDLAAFETLVSNYQHSVYAMVVRMLGDTRDADDIAQQAFLRVWKSARRWKPSAKFSTWLYTIVRNLTLNEIRRRKRHPTSSLDDSGKTGSTRTAKPDKPAERHERVGDQSASSPSDDLLHSELEQAVEDAIAALPENQRMALILWRYEALPYEDIAKVLKTTPSAVKSLLFRARTELKEKLARYLNDA